MSYDNNKPKILLAMSGGVDSSAAIVLLKEKYHVIGVTFLFCNENPNDAKAVAAKFGIKLHIVNQRQAFDKRVMKLFCDSWICGQTPNPCAICNRFIKFPSLFEKADELNCDYVATGHYSRSEGGFLKCGVTEAGEINPKDQSYMLYALTSEQLSRIVFPLGRSSKSEVRRIAAEHQLVNADKPDSQDICFVPDGDYVSFIRWFTGKHFEEGDFVDKNGTVIGRHRGHIHYTLGQRRGLGISGHDNLCGGNSLSGEKRLYVTDKSAEFNTVTVGKESDLYVENFEVCDVIWHVKNIPATAQVKIRYGLTTYPCKIQQRSTISSLTCSVLRTFKLRCPAPGQCAVFYDDDKVIGGGIIC